jgi:glycosyltransferase involved in cell wall biosynthesis
MSKSLFSIVIPVYFNEPNIPYTIPRLEELQKSLPDYTIEFIFVDDGSRDRSLDLLLHERERNENIRIIKLSKNFGSNIAIQAGIRHAKGDCIGILAADLQDPPELFVEMLQKWKEGYKIVMAVREDREEPWHQKFLSNSTYYLMRKIAFPDYPEKGYDLVLFDKQVANELCQYSGRNSYLPFLIFSLGHKRFQIPYVRRKREHGKSQWTFSKKIKAFIDSIVNFSYVPLRLISFIGFIVAGLSFIYGIIVIAGYLRGEVPIEGWTSIIVIMTFLLGLIIIMLGIIGEYLWRTLDEARQSPVFIIDEIYE